MKAILITQPGGPEVLRYGEAPDPLPGDGDLVVRTYASAINRADVMQRRGNYAPPPGASPILGLELAGEVERGAGDWKPGDRVMAVVTGGGYAEKAAFPAGMAMRIPDRLSYTEAAAIPEAFLTAYLNLFTLGRLAAGETVLIHAGASGVGTAALQLAKAAGAQVCVTAGSESKLLRCRELGAEVTINYQTENFADRVLEGTDGRGADVVLDFVGAPYWEGNMRALATGGRLMFIGSLGGTRGELDMGAIMAKSLTLAGTTLRRYPLPRKMELVKAFAAFALPRFESGELMPIIDTVLPLAEAATAHARMESNANIGKIVLKVD
ncbi:MAG TPA: NAD(P)H-quinone oxidoreductase [Aggregatilineales bacterium]|nr:NAD(P)H-quinone oxidoreductase [Aggregatilineales bacterium]